MLRARSLNDHIDAVVLDLGRCPQMETVVTIVDADGRPTHWTCPLAETPTQAPYESSLADARLVLVAVFAPTITHARGPVVSTSAAIRSAGFGGRLVSAWVGDAWFAPLRDGRFLPAPRTLSAVAEQVLVGA